MFKPVLTSEANKIGGLAVAVAVGGHREDRARIPSARRQYLDSSVEEALTRQRPETGAAL